MKRPQLLLGAMNVLWGMLSVTFAFLSSKQAFYIIRLLLGVAEAASFPGAWYYLQCFVPNQHLTVALYPVELSILIAQSLSAPIAYIVFKMDGLFGLHDW